MPSPLPKDLATAIVAAVGLREVFRIGYYYPGVLKPDVAEHYYQTLSGQLERSLTRKGLRDIKRDYERPGFPDASAESKLTPVIELLVTKHPASDLTRGAEEPEVRRVFKAAYPQAARTVRQTACSLFHVETFDCRIPCPPSAAEFAEPGRFLQMARTYWELVKQIVIVQASGHVSFKPHTLLTWIVNLDARARGCFERLGACPGYDGAKQTLAIILTKLSTGPTACFALDPDWTSASIERIDLFLEQARLALGSRLFPLTWAEEMCVHEAEEAILHHKQRAADAWAKQQAANPDAVAGSASAMRKLPKPGHRACRLMAIEALKRAIYEHVRAVRDHVVDARDRGEGAELLPRPSQKQLAMQLNLSESAVSRAFQDDDKELKILWKRCTSINAIMGQ